VPSSVRAWTEATVVTSFKIVSAVPDVPDRPEGTRVRHKASGMARGRLTVAMLVQAGDLVSSDPLLELRTYC
jgi:hypothetical protein